MPPFLIPIVLAGVVLVPLGVLLWLGARERRQFTCADHAELGALKLFKSHWQAVTPKRFGPNAISISGVGKRTGPTLSQTRTLDFVQSNATELFALAIGAAREAIAAAEMGAQPDDLRVSEVFLDQGSNCFELSLESGSCSRVAPDGVTVSFAGKQIVETEFVH